MRWRILVGWLAVLPLLWWSVRTPDPRRFVDLAVYREAGGHLGDLYGFTTANGLPFTYPPFAALLAAPLRVLPLPVVGVLWGLGVVAGLAWLVQRARPSTALLPAVLLLAAALWTQPLRDTVRFGQVGVLLAVLVLADCTSTRWRGVLVGVAAAVKLTPALFVVHLWLSGRRRDACTAAATAAGCTLLGAVLLPHASWRYWTSALFDVSRVGAVDDGGNQSWNGFLERAGLPRALLLLLVPLLVVGLRRAARGSDPVAAACVVGCLAVVVSPVSWIHTQVWLVLALLLLARTRPALALAGLALLWARLPWQASALLLDDVPGRPLWLLVQGLQGLGCVAVVLLLPVHREPREDLLVQEPVAADDAPAVRAARA
ncbi:MAG: hypothetical protein JWM64_212 [Frankiales bacterium]|nr:hypothetical protein [Frankiales bacterium]